MPRTFLGAGVEKETERQSPCLMEIAFWWKRWAFSVMNKYRLYSILGSKECCGDEVKQRRAARRIPSSYSNVIEQNYIQPEGNRSLKIF